MNIKRPVPLYVGPGYKFYPLLEFSWPTLSNNAGGNNGNFRVWLSRTKDLVVSIAPKAT